MQEDLTEVVAKLRELGKLLLDTKPVKCMVTAEERNFEKLHKQVDNFLGNLSQKPATSNISVNKIPPKHLILTLKRKSNQQSKTWPKISL